MEKQAGQRPLTNRTEELHLKTVTAFNFMPDTHSVPENVNVHCVNVHSPLYFDEAVVNLAPREGETSRCFAHEVWI